MSLMKKGKKKIEWVFSFENSINKDSTTNDSSNKA